MIRLLATVAALAGAVALAGCYETPSSSGADEPATTAAAPPTTSQTTTGAAPAPAGGDAAAGEGVFTSAGCGSCHTLAAAGATGTVGPNLDETKPNPDLVVERVTNGAGPMPAFAGTLSEQQILDVAAFVSESAGG